MLIFHIVDLYKEYLDILSYTLLEILRITFY